VFATIFGRLSQTESTVWNLWSGRVTVLQFEIGEVVLSVLCTGRKLLCALSS